jgi:hypothetical protein
MPKNYECFISFARKFTYINEPLEAGARFFAFGGWGCRVVEYIADFQTGDKFNKAADVFFKAATGLSLFRFFGSLMEAVSGRMFFEWSDELNDWERDEAGNLKWRDAPTIAARMCIAAGRGLGTVFLAMHCDIIDFGKHTKGMSQAVIGMWGAVVSLYGALSTYFLIKAVNEYRAARSAAATYSPADDDDDIDQPDVPDLEKAKEQLGKAIGCFIVCLSDFFIVVDLSVIGDIFQDGGPTEPIFPIIGAACLCIGNLLYCLYELRYEIPVPNKPRFSPEARN